MPRRAVACQPVVLAAEMEIITMYGFHFLQPAPQKQLPLEILEAKLQTRKCKYLAEQLMQTLFPLPVAPVLQLQLP